MNNNAKKIQMRRGYRVSIDRSKGFQAFVNPEILFRVLCCYNDFSDTALLRRRVQQALDFLTFFPKEEQAINVSAIASYVAEQSFGLSVCGEGYENHGGPGFVLELPMESARDLLLRHLRLNAPRQAPLDRPDMVLVTVPESLASSRGFDHPTVADVLYALQIAKPLDGPLSNPIAAALNKYREFLSWAAAGEAHRKDKANLPAGDSWQAQGAYPYIEAMKAITPVWATDTEVYKKWVATIKALEEKRK